MILFGHLTCACNYKYRYIIVINIIINHIDEKLLTMFKNDASKKISELFTQVWVDNFLLLSECKAYEMQCLDMQVTIQQLIVKEQQFF